MTFYVEAEAELFGDNDINEITRAVINAVMASENCPYEVTVNILITDNERMRRINLASRQLDEPTDVLSFPFNNFRTAADFSGLAARAWCFDPDSGELLLGDIVICAEKVREQSQAYGHSLKREYAFLLTHSLFHLLGYDHLQDTEADNIMKQKQENILRLLKIGR